MRKIMIIILSTIINFVLGSSLLFVALYVFILISGYGVDVGEEMPFVYVPVGILLLIFYFVLLVVPNRYFFIKNAYSKIFYITINLISYSIGIIMAFAIFSNWR